MNRSKFGNTKIVNEYGSFDSKKEFERYLYLLDQEKKGTISNLQKQVAFELVPPQFDVEIVKMKTKSKKIKKLKERASYYYADFTYIKDGEIIVEDVKASKKFQDDLYRLKRKLMLYVHGITIKEIY